MRHQILVQALLKAVARAVLDFNKQLIACRQKYSVGRRLCENVG